MLYIAQDYEGFTFSNADDVRDTPFGEIADYQIVGAPPELQSELGCWVTLPTRHVTQIS